MVWNAEIFKSEICEKGSVSEKYTICNVISIRVLTAHWNAVRINSKITEFVIIGRLNIIRGETVYIIIATSGTTNILVMKKYVGNVPK